MPPRSNLHVLAKYALAKYDAKQTLRISRCTRLYRARSHTSYSSDELVVRKGCAVDAWPRGINAITLFVEDLEAAKTFYQDVFGFPIMFEDDDSAVFNFGNTLINLLKSTAADELIGPAKVASPEAGSRTQFTIDVDDVDATCDRLAAIGVQLLNGPMDRPWGIRTASFRDPGGHIWEIAK